MNWTSALLAVGLLVLASGAAVVGPVGGDAGTAAEAQAERCDSTVDAGGAEQNDTQEPARPVVTVVPESVTILEGHQTVFEVCVVNPPGNTEAIDPHLVLTRVPESGDRGPAMVAVHRTVENGTWTNALAVDRLDRSMSGGHGLLVRSDALRPGEGEQYSLVVTNASPAGDFTIEATVSWTSRSLYPTHESFTKMSTLFVETPPCGLVCTSEQFVGGIVAWIDQNAPEIAAVTAVLTLLVILIGARNIRSRFSDRRGGEND